MTEDIDRILRQKKLLLEALRECIDRACVDCPGMAWAATKANDLICDIEEEDRKCLDG